MSEASDFWAGSTDSELETVCEALGLDRASVALGISKDFLRKELAKRSITINGASPSHPNPRVQHLQRHVKKIEQRSAAERELADSITRAAAEAPVLPSKPARVVRAGKSSLFDVEVEVVLHVSDIQFGEVVHEEEVPGGSYSPDVFENERLPRYLDATTKMLEAVSAQHPINKLWICQGGDFVEGHDVFKGQAWHLALDAGQQVAQLAAHWAGAVNDIATTTKTLNPDCTVAIISVPGNHGVHGGRSAGAMPPTLSYDWLTYELVAAHLSGMSDNGGVDFIDRQAHRAVYFESAGHVFLLTHGDQDRGGNGVAGVPVVSMFKNDLTVRQATGLNHRYHLSGHVHRPTSFTIGGDAERLVNGDWVGSNNLSVGRGGGSEPTQRSYVVHPAYGISQAWPIRLAPGTSRGKIEIVKGDVL